MSDERKVDPLAGIILMTSIVGLILVATQYFASLWSGAYYYHSCLDCEYSTPGDLTAQILILIFFIIQIIVSLNDLLPKRFIKKELSVYGMGLAGLTLLFVIIGIAAFGAAYDAIAVEWWPDTGFYGSLIPAIVNIVLFYLKFRNK